MLGVAVFVNNPRLAKSLVEGGAFSWLLRRVDRVWSRAAHRARERIARRKAERDRADRNK
jgi:hypothetical protein